MAKKAKVKCKVVEQGDRGVMLKIDVDAPGFGSMDCQLKYSLESDEMMGVVLQRGRELEAKIDNMEVGTEPGEIQGYVGACVEALSGLMEDIRVRL